MKVECDRCGRLGDESEKSRRDRWHVIEIDEDVTLDLCDECYQMARRLITTKDAELLQVPVKL